MLSLLKHSGLAYYRHILQDSKIFYSVLTILFCLLLSAGTSAQSFKSIKNDNPLYVIDGKLIPDSLSANAMKSLNKNNVFDISVLDYSQSTAIYGIRGAHGAIIIRTKAFQKTDTTKLYSKGWTSSNKNAAFIIDGTPSVNKLYDIAPANILNIDVFKTQKNSSSNELPHTTVIVTTKQYAIEQYQKKFSGFSKKYKDFIESHQNNDDSCTYLSTAGILYNNIHDRVKNLYNIPNKSIEKVDIIENQWYNGGESKKYLVTITTKK